jgi:hypothetical protein
LESWAMIQMVASTISGVTQATPIMTTPLSPRVLFSVGVWASLFSVMEFLLQFAVTEGHGTPR